MQQAKLEFIDVEETRVTGQPIDAEASSLFSCQHIEQQKLVEQNNYSDSCNSATDMNAINMVEYENSLA